MVWAVATAEREEIDRLNILRATHLAMRRAVEALDPQPEHCLIDGLPVRGFPFPHDAIVKGDGLSLSIAAASIIAKVTPRPHDGGNRPGVSPIRLCEASRIWHQGAS